MSTEKRKEFLESIEVKEIVRGDEERPIHVRIPLDVEEIDYGNIFLNIKMQSEAYRKQDSEEQTK